MIKRELVFDNPVDPEEDPIGDDPIPPIPPKENDEEGN